MTAWAMTAGMPLTAARQNKNWAIPRRNPLKQEFVKQLIGILPMKIGGNLFQKTNADR